MKQAAMISRSMRKAAARSLRDPSSTGSATPSGVMISRRAFSSESERMALSLAVAAIGSIPSGEAKIEAPHDRRRRGNRVAQGRVRNQLTAETLEEAGNQQQRDGADHDLRREPAGHRQVGKPAVGAGKGERATKRQTRGAA